MVLRHDMQRLAARKWLSRAGALAGCLALLTGCVTVPLNQRPNDNLLVEQIERIDEYSPVPVIRDRDHGNPEIQKVTSRRTLVPRAAPPPARPRSRDPRASAPPAGQRSGSIASGPKEDKPDWAGIVRAIGPSGKSAARQTARFASSSYTRGRGWVTAAARATSSRFARTVSHQAPTGEYMVPCPPGQPGRGGLSWPCAGKVSRGFNPGINHKGIDICAPEGTPVVATRSGRVVYSGKKLSGYGNVVILEHGGNIATVYAHNSRNLVSDGDYVRTGQTIALVGQTGDASTPHCHFEVRCNTEAIDPRPFLP